MSQQQQRLRSVGRGVAETPDAYADLHAYDARSRRTPRPANDAASVRVVRDETPVQEIEFVASGSGNQQQQQRMQRQVQQRHTGALLTPRT